MFGIKRHMGTCQCCIPGTKLAIKEVYLKASALLFKPAGGAWVCARADGVLHPTIAGTLWISVSFSKAATMNSAKSTLLVQLLPRMGSPT